MADIYSLRQDRDEALVWAFTDEASSLKDRYVEWIRSEIKDSLLLSDMIISTGLTGTVKKRLESQVQRLKEIEELCIEKQKDISERCKELRKGDWDNILEDHRYLQECLSSLHGYVRELHSLRNHLDGLAQ